MKDVVNALGEEEWAADALSLLLFARLALAADADSELASCEFGRTHHRILFLVAHRPGVTIGEIVTLLRLSAQAIQGPLRGLIDAGMIEQQSSERDRRKRHLNATAIGEEFLAEISNGQFERIANARRRAGDDSYDGFVRFMRALMEKADREWLYPSPKFAHIEDISKRPTRAKTKKRKKA
ncbi:MAG: MarR family transcriptional regulator [Marinicaulis sp.]|nr:MarR family transcriptional regulator [Marinicaulis sp.]NNE41885.1 MarR family transcriptional regulator [Marinicaulis sp.]